MGFGDESEAQDQQDGRPAWGRGRTHLPRLAGQKGCGGDGLIREASSTRRLREAWH